MLSDLTKWMLYLCAAGWIATIFLMVRLPPAPDIRKELYTEPLQTSIAQPEFSYKYKNQSITVEPVAEYLLTALIVSHNDPTEWYKFDITHDALSPNILDICVIWGSNLQSDDYKRVHFHNDDWSCSWKYGDDVHHINEDEISNNHLLASDETIRNQISHLHIGDQVRIHGRLVNYSEQRWHGHSRNTSTTRSDRGNGACEIILVDKVEILQSYNGRWAKLHELCYQGLVIFLAIGTIRFFWLPPAKQSRNF